MVDYIEKQKKNINNSSKTKFRENFFYSTISYAKEYSHTQLINEQKKIHEELKAKEQFLENYNQDVKKIIRFYDKHIPYFEEAEKILKSCLKVEKFYESSFFKKKEKIDLYISKENLDKFKNVLKKGFNNLFKAFYENRSIITKGLYTKITFKFYKLNPSGDYYNLRQTLTDEASEGSIPGYLRDKELNAMGDKKYTDRMFKIIPPGLTIFNITEIDNSVEFYTGGPFRNSNGEWESKSGEFFKFNEIYTERAIKNINKLNDALKECYEVNYGAPYSVLSVPKKIYYKKIFEEEKEIRLKQLRQIELYIRSKEDQVKKEEGVGYIYAAKSIGYPGMYKIGSTYGNPKKRVEELSGTNVPDPWVLAAKIKIKDAEYYEKLIHKLLSNFRYRKDREFFKIDLSTVKKYFNDILKITNNGNAKNTLSDLKKKLF